MVRKSWAASTAAVGDTSVFSVSVSSLPLLLWRGDAHPLLLAQLLVMSRWLPADSTRPFSPSPPHFPLRLLGSHVLMLIVGDVVLNVENENDDTATNDDSSNSNHAQGAIRVVAAMVQ